MARSKSKSKTTTKFYQPSYIGRDVNTIANRRLPRSTHQRFSKVHQHSYLLNIAQNSGVDNRYYHPINKRFQPPKTIMGNPAPVKTFVTKKLWSKSYFAVPQVTAVCVRRHQRREIMFAKGLGGRFHRPKLFNAYSGVRC